jgi:MoaA/NifB/PqqE/SkfB family radical SAM enzyme
MTDVIARLPIVILNIHSRCNCRCAMCDIWKTAECRELPLSFVEHHIEAFVKLGVRRIVLSGGEPLMHSALFRMCELARSRGIRATVLTSGLLISRYASEIVRHVDDLIVSIDGPPEIHDRIRGVAGAFTLIAAGIERLRRATPASCRCTVQKANHAALQRTIEAARNAGFSGISFLAADLASHAFNRPSPWDAERQSRIALSIDELPVLRDQIEDVIASGDPFVRDTPAHLRRIVHHFESWLGLRDAVAPRCNAPWASAVVEADGALRPCFFHPVVAHVHGSFDAALNSRAAVEFRRSLDVAVNATCRNCVCSLYVNEADASAHRATPHGKIEKASQVGA